MPHTIASWKQEWPNTSGYWWEWIPGQSEAHMVLWPEYRLGQRRPNKPVQYYAPVETPNPPTGRGTAPLPPIK